MQTTSSVLIHGSGESITDCYTYLVIECMNSRAAGFLDISASIQAIHYNDYEVHTWSGVMQKGGFMCSAQSVNFTDRNRIPLVIWVT